MGTSHVIAMPFESASGRMDPQRLEQYRVCWLGCARVWAVALGQSQQILRQCSKPFDSFARSPAPTRIRQVRRFARTHPKSQSWRLAEAEFVRCICGKLPLMQERFMERSNMPLKVVARRPTSSSVAERWSRAPRSSGEMRRAVRGFLDGSQCASPGGNRRSRQATPGRARL
jgi:hypothetical protein